MTFASCQGHLRNHLGLGRPHQPPLSHLISETIGRDDIPFLQAEGFLYIPSKIYEERTGKYMQQEGPCLPEEPAGDHIDMEDKAIMEKLLPRLVARMPEPGPLDPENG